jgi:arylformamidase
MSAAPIDVSVPIRPRMPIYAGDPGVAITRAKAIDDGDPVNLTRLDIGAHTGTHVDAPVHFIPAAGPIDAALVDALGWPAGTERVLFKTRNSRLWERDSFTSDFVRLDGGGAAALIERGVRLVGIDYLSIGDSAAHVALLDRGVGVIEGLDLRAVDPGSYFLICLPLKIAGSDGAPARAVLWPLAGGS